MSAEAIVDTLLRLDPLADLPRTGWVLRGVAQPESIAAHSHGVAVVAMMLTDALREAGETVDGERVLRMAVLHDAPEAATGDIPLPSKTPALSQALEELEAKIAEDLLAPSLHADWREAAAKQTLEARIVKASDKIQMMIKVLAYEARRGAALEDFWVNPKNFDDRDLAVAREVFDAIAKRAGRTVPR